VQKSNEDLAALMRMLPRGRSPNASAADVEGSPSQTLTNRSMEQRDQSSEMGVIRLQLENMQLNLQSAHEEIKVVRLKCERAQTELVDAQMQVARANRECENLRQERSEGCELTRGLEAELQTLRGEHAMYARMVFRLSKRCCTLLRRWSTFPSRYSTRACFGSWIESVRRIRLVRKHMHAAFVRRCCHMKRATLSGWFRTAVARRGNEDMAERDGGSASGSAELRQALGIITNRKSISPHAVRSNAQSPAVSYSDSSAATKAQLANTLSAALSALSTTTSLPPMHEHEQGTHSAAPLDTLQRLKNVYRPANNSFMSSSDAMPQESFSAGSSRHLSVVDGAPSPSDVGPLAWFLKVHPRFGSHCCPARFCQGLMLSAAGMRSNTAQRTLHYPSPCWTTTRQVALIPDASRS
jgi:exonuclease VII large subunit